MSLGKHILSYGAFNAINAAVPFLLMPVLTVRLSPQDYGVLSLAQLLITLALPLVLINTHGLFVIERTRLSGKELAGLVSAMVWLPVAGCAAITMIFWAAHGALAALFKLPDTWVVMIPVFCLVQSVPTLVPVIFQGRQQAVHYGAFKTALSILNLGLSILFVISLAMGWEGRLWGIFWANVVFTAVGLLTLRREGLLILGLFRQQTLSALRFGLPLIPHSVSGILLAMSDRIFLANIAGPGEAGVYSVAYQIASGVGIIMTSINQAWAPHLFGCLNKDPGTEEKRTIVRRTYRIISCMAGIAIVYAVIMYAAYDFLIGPAFHSGKVLALILAGAFCLQGAYYVVTNYIYYVRKTHVLSGITTSCLIASAIGNVALIPLAGSYGAAAVMLAVWLAMFVLTWVFAARLFPMPWLPSRLTGRGDRR